MAVGVLIACAFAAPGVASAAGAGAPAPPASPELQNPIIDKAHALIDQANDTVDGTQDTQAGIGDTIDDASLQPAMCVGEALGQTAALEGYSATGVGGCGHPGHGGVTYYKPRSKSNEGTPVAGNYNHKVDNELHAYHCKGWDDDNCHNEVWLSNHRGNVIESRHYYGSGRGFTGSSFPRTAGRPFCEIWDTSTSTPDFSCYYVYG
jgi:hypothetical protein